MKFAVFSVGLPEHTPEEAVALLRDTGYDGVEWRVVDQQPSADGRPGFWRGNRCTWPLATLLEDAPRIKALTDGAGLAMPVLGAYATCHDLPAVERAMRGARALGVTQLRVNAGTYDGTRSYMAQRAESQARYREVEAMARSFGLRALVELHHRSLLPSASAAAAFLADFDPQHVGVIHDAGNMVYEGFEQYRLGLETLGPYLAHIHLKNARWRAVRQRPDGSTEWQPEAAPLTEGIVDIAALVRALRQVGYDGWISFEDFSTERPVTERLRANLDYVRRVVAAIDNELTG